MNARPGLPKPQPPVQAHPVPRDNRDDPPAQQSGPGVDAAKSACAHLPGLARQMCYAALYGG